MSPVYEVNDGDLREAVEGQCRHIVGAGGFTTSTRPTLDEVNRYTDMAYYKVAGMIVTMGYSPAQDPVAAVNAVGWLQNLQMYETVVLIEMSSPMAANGKPSTRFQEFIAQRDTMLTLLLQHQDLLEDLGAVRVEELGAFTEFRGVSRAAKLVVKTDPDFVPYRFNRGMGTYPGAPSPDLNDPMSDEILG